MECFFLNPDDMSLELNIKVFTNSNKNQLSGSTVEYKGKHYMKFFVCKSPVRGEANKVIISTLSELVDTKKSNISITSGSFDQYKRILIKLDSSAKLLLAQSLLESLLSGGNKDAKSR